MVAMLFSSCKLQMEVNAAKGRGENKIEAEIIICNTKVKTYKGWWIYGEGQHLLKDEETLEEFDLKFLNENMEELRALYLAVCEMEYFPMECAMTGHLERTVLEKQNTLIVSEFEILYI